MKGPALLPILISVQPLIADVPADNDPSKVRRLPPPGVEEPAEIREDLEQQLAALRGDLKVLRLKLEGNGYRSSLLPNIEIFAKAVDYALRRDEFQRADGFKKAGELLVLGRERAGQLERGETPWLMAKGLVVHGFRSRLPDRAVIDLTSPPTTRPASG